jgi:hypothetical protein
MLCDSECRQVHNRDGAPFFVCDERIPGKSVTALPPAGNGSGEAGNNGYTAGNH